MYPPCLALRPARRNDRNDIEQLAALSARLLTAGDYPPDAVEAALRSGAWALDPQLIADGCYYVVLVDGALAACGGWSFRDELHNRPDGTPAPRLLDPASEPAKIRGFYTHPDYAGCGLASLLLRCCERAAFLAGFNALELAATPAGEPLYRRNGYAGVRPVRYPVGEGHTLDALIMRKPLGAGPRSIAAPPEAERATA
ncbi:MAG: GNAT family N-acetyltransferase [Parasphingopyxis sp.]|uniref:GNAT family N-acetyltransferase n=1 Tax=Parasphingopyxis sp. TaxID=1920299 RepID=UPI003FA00399